LAWKYLPGHIPILVGISNSGFGMGAFTFTMIGTNVVNPDGKSPTDKDSEGNNIYPPDVASNVPFML